MKKIVAGAMALSALALVSCGDSDEAQGDGGPGKITAVQDADGKEVELNSDVPQVDGLDISEPTNDEERISTLCNITNWWLNPDVPAGDREEVSPYLLNISLEGVESGNMILSEVSASSVAMARAGYEVGPELNQGQDMARRSCGTPQ